MYFSFIIYFLFFFVNFVSSYGSARWNTSRRQPLNAECPRHSCIIIIFRKTSRPNRQDDHVHRVSKRVKCTTIFLFLQRCAFSISTYSRPLVMASLLLPTLFHPNFIPLSSTILSQPILLTHLLTHPLYKS